MIVMLKAYTHLKRCYVVLRIEIPRPSFSKPIGLKKDYM